MHLSGVCSALKHDLQVWDQEYSLVGLARTAGAFLPSAVRWHILFWLLWSVVTGSFQVSPSNRADVISWMVPHANLGDCDSVLCSAPTCFGSLLKCSSGTKRTRRDRYYSCKIDSLYNLMVLGAVEEVTKHSLICSWQN